MGLRVAVLRHLLAIAILPFSVTVVVPYWIAQANGMTLPGLFPSPGGGALQILGALLLAIGLTLFVTSLRRFAVEGQGTLAPWDPPKDFVVRGPYRFVRNPMISGVVFGLFGEASVLASGPHARWALIFLLANALWIPLFEEPQLEARFGESYREYCRNVPRWIPRLTPWQPQHQ